ncbi:13699_t:CDS:2, partial [Gigaspora rosea]
ESSALVGNRLYFFGSSILEQARDNIYLDVTLSTLNTTSPSCTPNISGLIPLSRKQFQAVDDTNGKIYMFGGITPNSSSRDNIFDDIYILDTLILAWKQGSNFHPPTPRVDFTATLLNNGLILYIGGTIGHVASIYMSAIPTYNTNNNSWGAMSATGDVLNSRSCHTAVLSPDGHVIIYGGNIDGTTDQSQVLASLDTTVSPYKWSIKPMIGDNVPPSLAFHSANV